MKLGLRQVVVVLSVLLAASVLGTTAAIWEGARGTLERLTDLAGRSTWVVQQKEIVGLQPRGLPQSRSRLEQLERQTGATRIALATGQVKMLGAFAYAYQGVSSDFFALRRLTMARGRSFASKGEVVVGARLGDRLGERITVGFGEYRVVGVLEAVAQRDETDGLLDSTAFVSLEGYAGVSPEVSELFLETSVEGFGAARTALEVWLGPQRSDYSIERLADRYGLRLREQVARLLSGALSVAVLCTLLVAGFNLYGFFTSRALERLQATAIRRAVGASRGPLLLEELQDALRWVVLGIVLGVPLVLLLNATLRRTFEIPAQVGPWTVLVIVLGIVVLVGGTTVAAHLKFLLRPPVDALRGGVRQSLRGGYGLASAGLVLGLCGLVMQSAAGRSATLETARLTGQLVPRVGLYSPFLLRQDGFADPRGQVSLRRSSYLALKRSPVVQNLEHLAFSMTRLETLSGPQGERFSPVTIIEGDYQQIVQPRFVSGRWPIPGRSEVALGHELARILYGGPTATVNQTLSIFGRPFQIVGVFEGTGTMGLGLGADRAVVPMQDTQVNEAGGIWVQVRQDRDLTEVLAQVTRHLNERYGRADLQPIRVFQAKDFAPDLERTLRQLSQVYQVLSVGLLLLGALGLGLHQLNLVVLRVGEIGVRRAVGASPRHILGQFLWEALGRAGLAGLVGVGLGVVVSWLIARTQGVLWSLDSRLLPLALGIALGVGLLGALGPARWAASLTPLRAFREHP